MRYMLLIYGDESAAPDLPEGDDGMKEWFEYTQWLVDQGWMRSGDPLEPSTTATTVRLRDGDVVTTDGPYAETKEQLGGYYIVECDDLDQAVQAAARCPAARYGSMEVRPIAEIPSP